jgi:hypothetical protein
MSAKDPPFPLWLRWALLAPYAVFAAGGLIVGVIRIFNASFSVGDLGLLFAPVFLVQFIAVLIAMTHLIRDRRYRSVANILTFYAGALAIFMLVVGAVSGNFRIHM